MQNAAQKPPRFTDCILTMDAHWLSPSYRGMSMRSELWLSSLLLLLIWVAMTLCLARLGLHDMCWEETGASSTPVAQLVCELLFLLVEVLFFCPLLIRRARQMEAVWYGAFALVWWLLPNVFSWGVYLRHGYLGQELLCGMGFWLNLPVLLPLFLIGGTFSGRKNGLHRAAIAGDRARVAQFLAFYPSMLLRKSEKGRTAREYAQRAGHRDLAAWLAEQEARSCTENGG